MRKLTISKSNPHFAKEIQEAEDKRARRGKLPKQRSLTLHAQCPLRRSC